MHPAVIASLVRNTTPYVRCVNAVVSDVTEPDVNIWVSGFNIFEKPEGGWDNLKNVPGAMKNRGNENRGRGKAIVDFLTLDDYCTTAKPPDLIKIDVEGYQTKALLGARKLIRGVRPIIIIELHDPEKLERLKTSNEETTNILFGMGYTGYWCGNFRSPDAEFEQFDSINSDRDKLSLAVFIP